MLFPCTLRGPGGKQVRLDSVRLNPMKERHYCAQSVDICSSLLCAFRGCLRGWRIDFASPHFTSLHFTSLHFTSLQFASLPFASRPLISLYFASLFFFDFTPFYSVALFSLFQFALLFSTSVHFASVRFASLRFASLHLFWAPSPCKGAFSWPFIRDRKSF